VAGEVWIRMLASIPYLSSPTRGSPLGAALRARTARRPYPGTDKGSQVPHISQRWTQKWWYDDAKMEHPAHPVGAAPHWFKNRDHDGLDPRDFCRAASRRFGIMVMIASGPMTSIAQ
jgi:hypothetical protein